MSNQVPLKRLFKVILVIRCVQALLTRTFFQADEFWQSLEPAHYMAFGYGELTWEWSFGLRSYAFPLIFQIGYTLVKYAAISCELIVQTATDWVLLFVANVIPNSEFGWEMVQEMRSFPEEIRGFIEYQGVIYAPKLIMAVLAAIGEFHVILLAEKLYKLTMDKSDDSKGSDKKHSTVINFTLVATVSNFFNCFFITRSFINSFEMILTSVSLYYWDWTSGEHIESFDFLKSLIIGTFTVLQRPTNAFIWLILGGYMILNLVLSKRWRKLFSLLIKVICASFISISTNLCIDYYFYGYITIPVLKFIKFNCTSSLSKFYGVAPWNFHVFQSLPIVAGYSLPLLIHSFFCSLTKKRFLSPLVNPFLQIKTVVLLNVILYSLIPHKEFRFIYPLQPFFIILSVFDGIWLLQKYGSTATTRTMEFFSQVMWILPVVSMVASMLLSTLHESGTVAVMDYLHSIRNIDSIGFIMPCHSTPWQSHFHRNDVKELWAITCSPPLHLLTDPDANAKLPFYMDESDYLYDNISKFMYQHFPPVFRKSLRSPGKQYTYEWPEYLVIFEDLDSQFMNDYLVDSMYIEETRFFNSLVHWDKRRSGDIIIYHKMP
ncbi:putative glycosylphosphatidylinositol-alpha 1,2 mannosyltransferase [Kluyveromyces lactis]|uniref:GPI mannosyltransferase 3 n=1 Tax=Kluyveromyces lactis (strain ATCC 8585 / CBS 2359 / DSM 70799 / NBRC 1267 / NRRL Y-1140 / WM37) TaxID=284590 RepID=GPI10_KLULA|nr:uncharacterized protein KLLA0_E14719g [Kluyveromyces lactis]Q6CN76.1 RecName: Full=GPI mannosyltransferase 3; AltName: Full=GPI mannosyltransferase III; Short=GPI-MT-III; AltName: Full=Glycosylphosphatidylinositol-anchor biosynthesis protein 10 [Kluyveromyces lactis NRRL Y-1140]CAG99700.1 KLLA0E14719p [Kluyveromyces lactis]|eukprot:XP_454613.1 uncharacterized protein KLLA0_E14719g [Kluyveromyces lactis]